MVGGHLFTVCFAGGAEELQQQLSAAPTTPSFDREISSAVTVFINQELKHYHLLFKNDSTAFTSETTSTISLTAAQGFLIFMIIQSSEFFDMSYFIILFNLMATEQLLNHQ